MQFQNDMIFNSMFTLIPIVFVLVFALVFIIMIVSLIKGVSRWSYNNKQPVLSVDSKIVSKRTDVSSHGAHNVNDNFDHHHTYTTYYITFEVESGDRIELKVQNTEYGLFVEGDKGKLTFQGSRYLGFERVLS